MRHPIQLGNNMGCLMEFYMSLTLFYTKMSFKFLKFSNRPSVFFPSSLLYTICTYHGQLKILKISVFTKKNDKFFLEAQGIDPRTSHMLSERSTI
jgi:hypothetical protein